MYLNNPIEVLFIFINLAFTSDCATKRWRHDTAISNPSNWVGNTLQSDCEGLVFADDDIHIPSQYVEKLNVKRVVLPRNGAVGFYENATIVFDEDSKDNMNCVHLKEPDIHIFSEWESWLDLDDPSNAAVPHAERIPCEHDDVVFPPLRRFQMVMHINEVTVKSVKIGDDYYDDGELSAFENSPLGLDTILLLGKINVKNEGCADPTGCVCGNNEDVCEFHRNLSQLECLEPITPVGFCEQICGASILLKAKKGFEIEKVREAIKQFSSQTYVSKVRSETNRSEKMIQVIFAEREFTGRSLEEAADFHAQLLGDKSWKASQVELFTSGPYYRAQKQNAISLVFGTLFGVLLFFLVLSLVWSPQFARLRTLTSFNRPLSTYIFARYDNIEDRGYIYEGQSLAGSILNLEKSFENPMFGKATPSTSTTSEDQIEEKITIVGSSHENPLYDLKNNLERESAISEKEEDVEEVMIEGKPNEEISEGILLEDF